MPDVERFPYVTIHSPIGEATLRPLMPAILHLSGSSLQVQSLLDTGADVNVLPYHLGVALNANWESARQGIRLSGNLARYEARGILLKVSVGRFPEVSLAFAWTRAENVPLIFGQVNFFTVFDVCFFRSRQLFEVRLKETE